MQNVFTHLKWQFDNHLMSCLLQVPYTDISLEAKSNIWPVIHRWRQKTDSFELVNAYGLFRRSVFCFSVIMLDCIFLLIFCLFAISYIFPMLLFDWQLKVFVSNECRGKPRMFWLFLGRFPPSPLPRPSIVTQTLAYYFVNGFSSELACWSLKNYRYIIFSIISIPCFCFNSMTGVGGRPEVIIEGSNDLDGPWLVLYLLWSFSPSIVSPTHTNVLELQCVAVSFLLNSVCRFSFFQEYNFHYKPGNVSESPPIVGKVLLLSANNSIFSNLLQCK